MPEEFQDYKRYLKPEGGFAPQDHGTARPYGGGGFHGRYA